MYNIYIFLFFACLINSAHFYSVVSVNKGKCGQNEEYGCKILETVQTCQHPQVYWNNSNCTVGCFCKEDYWRNEITGECVPMEECPCENGLVFRYSNPCINACLSEFCPLYIVAGCFCPADTCLLMGYCIPRSIFQKRFPQELA
ncbi:uncharacterized protein LOC143193128 isoform X1 [Rhynchophorus ferrugineus]